jgi:hypothetical protein
VSQINTEYLRVRQVDTDTGHITVTRGMYEFNPDAYEILDEPATDAGNNPLPPGEYVAPEAQPSVYEDWLVADLKGEIDQRNALRDPEGDNYLDGSGLKADLVAALDADDANQTGQ